jgi:hypothetical protein
VEKLLVMVPTRGRPQICKRMWDSFLATKSHNTEIILYFNDDDPKLEEYLDLFKTNYIVGKRLFLAEAYNFLFNKYSDYCWYSPINDDHVFITLGWDKKLIEVVETKGHGWGMACAEDGMTPWLLYQHPSGCVISGNIPRTLGYFIWPKIQHVGIDCFFMRLLQGIDRLYHVPEVVIEHRHWFAGKAFLDANYKFVYSNEQFNYGMAMVREYVDTQLETDIAKLKKEMEKC